MFGFPLFNAVTRGGTDDRYGNADSTERNSRASTSTGSCAEGGLTTAVEFPGLIPGGNYSPAGGCAIDTNSDLLFGDPATLRMKGGNQLFQRPFPTTPFMGMGDPDSVEDESKVRFGHSTANRKSVQTVTDKQFPVFEPLIPEKEADIPESNYFVEPFLRGGFSSRLVPKTRIDLKS
jgi:hypothetical protein